MAVEEIKKDLDFIARLDKEREYKDYVIGHIQAVEDKFDKLIRPLKGKYEKDVDDAIDACILNLPLHDLSKFSKAEFDAYRIHFYPTDQEKKDKVDADETQFDLAVDHHRQVNPHHPYYWNKGIKKEDMPLCYIFEMLCDWAAVSEYKDSDLLKWYKTRKSKEQAQFTDATKKVVEFWLDEIFKKPGIPY